MPSSIPVSIMVWTINDAVIEDHLLLQQQFEELRRAGFDGVAVYVRCSRYTWDDKPAHNTLALISSLCRKAGFHLWIGPDPRFISRQLISTGGGAEVLMFGEASRASTFPQLSPVIHGKFSARCTLNPRHGHMFNEVALEYTPVGVHRCYAVRSGRGLLGAEDIVDLTAQCRFFYNARDRYVEAFGQFSPPDNSDWRIVAFFHVVSTHADYSNHRQLKHYAQRLRDLYRAKVHIDSLMWDEPGYTCTYGTLPFTPAIRSAFRRTAGYPLDKALWKLAFDAEDGSHVPVRIQYYRIVQKTVNDAQRFTNRVMRQLWGPETLASVHDTWHFESADMCDMNHGSMDLWKASTVKSGGFVDLGGVNVLRDKKSPYYANLAAMSTIAASLGRHSKGRFAFNNLWTVGDDGGDGSQRLAMDHCVQVMALFGTRWLAHAYGPVGTIGEENSFLGSPPLPGYPHHSTWGEFPEWNNRLRTHFEATRGNLPRVNVMLVFPVETMYALANGRADELARKLFNLVLTLTDAQYQVDVVSTEQAAKGRWKGSRFIFDRIEYVSMIVPYTQVLDRQLSAVIRGTNRQILFVGGTPQSMLRTKKDSRDQGTVVEDDRELLLALESLGVSRPVRSPEGTWATLTHITGGDVITVIPSRCGGTYSGPVTSESSSIVLPESGGLTRIFIPEGRAPYIMQAT